MKKYVMLFLFSIVAFSLSSCRDSNDPVYVDNDTYPKMLDVTGTLSAGNDYTLSKGITIGSGDVVLVYRNINSNTANSAVWQLIPKTEYLGGTRELDYNFVFNTSTIEVYTEATFPQNTMSTAEANMYLVNQTFRLVLVPASQGRNPDLNYNDYHSVLKYYNIPDRN